MWVYIALFYYGTDTLSLIAGNFIPPAIRLFASDKIYLLQPISMAGMELYQL